jgi:hypothetical protein
MTTLLRDYFEQITLKMVMERDKKRIKDQLNTKTVPDLVV